MRITSKGQVTIPQDIRERYGFLPHTEVEFAVDNGNVVLRKTRQRQSAGSRVGAPLSRHCGRGHDHRRDHAAHSR